MGEMRRIEVEIDAALLAAADDAVEHGRFADRDAVIRHALSLWNERLGTTGSSSTATADLVRLRQMIDEGFASGDPIEATDDFYEDVKARGRARLKANHTAS